METSIKKTFKLNNGLEMPCFGLGTYQIPGLEDLVYECIKNGLRLIDTAAFYKNEKEVGVGIKKALTENVVKREELFIVTKMWYTDRSNPEESLKASLERLQLDYVDLYLDHWPITICEIEGKPVKTPMHIVWKNLENLVKKGLTKSIGGSNYSVQTMMNVLSFCEIKPVVNQIELHPYFPQTGIYNYCMKNDVLIMAYNSLVRGKYVQNKTLNLLEESVVIEIAKKHNKNPGHVAMNWALVKGLIIIPSTAKVSRFIDNYTALDFRLDDEDMKKMEKLDINQRLNLLNDVTDTYGVDIFA